MDGRFVWPKLFGRKPALDLYNAVLSGRSFAQPTESADTAAKAREVSFFCRKD